MKQKRYMLIYNPLAGRKRHLLSLKGNKTLKELIVLLRKYNIKAEVCVTNKQQDVKSYVDRAVKEKFDGILSAGGDGTVSEIANHIVGKNIILGILPLGSYMNVARMLSVPLDLEEAMDLINKGNVRKIDLGTITQLDGKVLEKPLYFIESAGVGYEAKIMEHINEVEKGKANHMLALFRTLRHYTSSATTVMFDNKEKIITNAHVITVSNGPYSGPAVKLAQQSKLNDHKLYVAIFTMSKPALFSYLFRLMIGGSNRAEDVTWYQAKEITLKATERRRVQADARIFGYTPVTFGIAPEALCVITGVPKNQKYIAGKE